MQVETQSVLDRMISRFKRSPEYQAEVDAEQKAAIVERKRLCGELKTALAAESKDATLAGLEAEQSRLVKEDRAALHNAHNDRSVLRTNAMRLRELAAAISKRRRVHRLKVADIRSRLKTTAPAVIEGSIQNLLERSAEVTALPGKPADREYGYTVIRGTNGQVLAKLDSSAKSLVGRVAAGRRPHSKLGV